MKLYGYFVNGVLMKVSPSKESLQELLMDDYYEEAFYQYNVLITAYRSIYRIGGLFPNEFWREVKNRDSNPINTRLSYRVINDLEAYYID